VSHPEQEKTPVRFHLWDREEQINYLTLGKTRADQLELIRDNIDSDRGSDRLSKEELAAIALGLGAVDGVRR
jgi:hypothetical protein